MSEKYYTHLGPNTIQEEYEYNHDKDYPLFISLAGTTKCDNEYEISRGVTSFYTIEYIINGTGYVQENDIICSPHCGDTYVFHPGAEQKFYSDPHDPWEKIWVIFCGPLADSLFDVYKLGNQVLFPKLDMHEPLNRLIKICAAGLGTEETMNKCSLVNLEMIQILHKYRLEHQNIMQTLDIADRLKAMIDDMWDFSISLTSLTNQLFCSRNHAIRIFTNKFGISPYQYIQKVRLKYALRMLCYSKVPLTQIADTLGFCDSRYFSNWFKKNTGISPRKFRADYQSGNNARTYLDVPDIEPNENA